ncbi:bifunctional phosphoglucose/phosphomannose isomerase [bacterium]|nr:bifunctional phosphoglucose/phosphomannose isomerase [bacterium]
MEKVFDHFDPMGMGDKIREFGDQILKGWDIGENSGSIPAGIDNIIFSGMGGSAIAGDVITSFFSESLSVPFYVNRGYDIPLFASSKSLFIASSYSGNTEETISAFKSAENKGTKIIAITSGGTVAEYAGEKGYPLFVMPGGYPPRSALGFPLGILMNILSRAGIISVSFNDLKQAVLFIKEEQEYLGNPEGRCASLAESLCGTLPFVYGASHGTDVIALRWKAQFNENSKIHAVWGVFSEMNHNEIMGWARHEKTGGFFDSVSAILLKLTDDHSRIKIRMDVTKRIISEQGINVFEIEAKGKSKLARLLYLISFGDWTSYYLAYFNGVDPTEIPTINVLKEELYRVK